MIIKTEFDLNDKVWFMKDNKPVQVIISSIEVLYTNNNQNRIRYNAKDIINSRTWLDHTNLSEDMLFTSKQFLLNSL